MSSSIPRLHEKDLARVAYVRRHLIAGVLLASTAPFGALIGTTVAGLVSLVSFATGMMLIVRAGAARCPMCGNGFFVRFHQHPTLPSSFG